MYQKSFLSATQQVGHHTGLDFVKKLAEDAMSPKYRAKALTILWIFLFIVLAILTLIVILFFGYINQFRLGVGISTGIWAVFFGTIALFFLSSKWLTTIAGGVAGIGTSGVGEKSNSLNQANDAVEVIAKTIAKVAPTQEQLNTFQPGQEMNPDPFTVSMIWLFLIIVGVLCIPAFFGGGGSGAAATNTTATGGEETSGAVNP
jgi:hypothetical protein